MWPTLFFERSDLFEWKNDSIYMNLHESTGYLWATSCGFIYRDRVTLKESLLYTLFATLFCLRF